MIVFDFDKTLTDNDTLFGFYKEVHPKGLSFKLKQVALLFVAVAMKLKIIGNDHLKKAGIFLFLKGRSETGIREAAKRYAKNIKLNPIYDSDFLLASPSKRIIISASFDLYLKELFPEEQIIGSTLHYKDGKVKGLKENAYGVQKNHMLKKLGVIEIDCLYTDSYSDKPLMDISKRVYLVRSGKKERIK
ncbi:MAG TPA: HAD family hydrolase [Aequorivita sp.]|nr:HAD family hydrolase [Aequorivita sp.]